MVDWMEVAVFPNLSVMEPIESRFMVLTSREDERVAAIERAHPNFRRFLEGFSDAFGVVQSPAVLLRNGDAPESLRTMDALAGFRDLVSLSVVPFNRSLEFLYPRGFRITWSDAFWIYPWMIDKNDQYMISTTPAQTALHIPEEFHGQSKPELPQMSLREHEVDVPLLKALTKRWQRRYLAKRPSWQDRALFRSLNMANQAAALPAGVDATLYDFGRLAALWVSAFEILARPRATQANIHVVCSLIERVNWKHDELTKRRYKISKSRKKAGPRHPLASWLYGKLYQARNDFIHGNPITSKNITIKKSGLPIMRFAAPLYRIALTGFLELRWTKSMPSLSEPDKFGKYIADKTTFVALPVECRTSSIACGHGPSFGTIGLV